MSNRLEIKLLLNAIDKVTAPFKKMRAAGGHTTEQLRKAQQRIKSLNRQSSQVDGYRKISKSLGVTSAQLKQAKAHVRQLAQQMEHSKAPSKALTKEFEQARAKTVRLNTQVKQLTATKHKQREALREAGIDTKKLAEHQRTLTANLSQANKQLAAQKQHLQSVAQQQKRLNRARMQRDTGLNLQTNMATNGAVSAATGTAALYATGQFLQPGLEFTAAQSKVQALTRLDKEDPELKALRMQARNLGATTSFTANDVSMGQSYLAMAGFDAKAIQQAMPGMLDLSVANGTDLAITSDIASNILSGFGLQADQMGRLGDVLTATTTRANVDLIMLGETMKYVAPAARDLGIGIEEAAAMSGLLGNVGIQASQGGTVLRALLNRLSSQTGPAAQAMEELGLKTKDAQGNLRAIPNILQDVVKATAQMGNADRAGILKTIFGEEAGTGVSELIKQQGDGAIKAFTAVLKNAAGENARVAKVMADNAKGDLQSLASAWDDVGIELFEGNDSGIRTLIKDVTSLVRSIGGWMKANPELTATIFKVAAAGAALAAIGGTLTVMIAGLIGPFVMTKYALAVLGIKHLPTLGKGFKLIAVGASKFGTLLKGAAVATRVFSLALLSTPIGWVIAGITALVTAGYFLIKNWDSVSAYLTKAWTHIKSLFNWTPLGIIINNFTPVKKWLAGLWPSISEIAKNGWLQLKTTFNWSPLGMIINNFEPIKKWLADLWPSISSLAAAGWQLLKAAFNWSPLGMIINNFNPIKKWLANLWPSISSQTAANWQLLKAAFNWSPLGMIINNFAPIKKWLANLWPNISSQAVADWQLLKAVFNWSPLGLIINNFAPIKKWLANLWPNINSQAVADWQLLKAAFNWSPLGLIINNFAPIKKWLANLWPNISSQAEANWQLLKAVFNWSPLGMIISNFAPIKKWLANLWPSISSKTTTDWQLLKAAFNWSPLGLIINNFAPIKKWLADLWPTINTKAAAEWKSFKALFNWSPLQSIAGGFNSAKTWLNNLWPTINTSAATGWQNFKAIFNWSPLQSIAGGFNSVKTWLSNLWPTINTNTAAGWQNFKAIFNWSPLQLITSGFNSAKTWLSNLWPTINTNAVAGWQNFKALFNWSPLNVITNHFNSVVSFFTNLPSKFMSFGEMTIDGFGKGIKSKLQSIKDSIFGIGQSAITSLKQTLGIASPSRVFATLGDQTMQGLQVGINRSKNEPLKQVNLLSKTIAGTALTVGAASLPVAAQPAQFAKAEQPTFVSGSQLYQPNQKQAIAHKQTKTIHIDASINAPITINAGPGINEQDIARQVATQMERIHRQQQAKIRATLGDIE